ncbi:serine hydrolase [Tomitella gaofuii]|uniref:serine hydrolase n=1 Tax=Tomitella gaofuii TaxID=2760083 RepID=UPI001C70BB9A|nr:serine hydrolase [Tomitella gaofuii]
MNTTRLLHRLGLDMERAGLRGRFLVRDLDGGAEIGLGSDAEMPIASLVKVPLAVAVLHAVHTGRLDGARMVDVLPDPAGPRPGPGGTSGFRRPSRIAVDDLVHLALTVSDNAAADALFTLVPPDEVTAHLRGLGVDGITVRHRTRDLGDTPAARLGPDDAHLAQELAIRSGSPAHGHAIAQLDVASANTGTAGAFADLLGMLWRPSTVPAPVAAQMRAHMARNMIRNRLAPDFDSDATTWSSKTGTILHYRHEAGVVEHDDGAAFAVVAMTASSVPAAAQPAAEAAMAGVARALHDRLRYG